LVELCDVFEKVANEADVDAVLSTNYIETRAAEVFAGINAVAKQQAAQPAFRH
jgi:hypothetical protein